MGLIDLKSNHSEDEKSFKQRKSLAIRKEEFNEIRQRFPNKIPIILERYCKEKSLPRLNKTKFLVPQELQIGQFIAVIRNRMHINSRQSFHLMINNRTIAIMSNTMSEIYKKHKDKDGFLYITYSAQEMFGCIYNNDNK